MTATPHVYSISYGGTTVPGTVGASRVELRRVYQIARDYRRFRVTFSLILVSPSEADFVADAAALESVFRRPRQDLVVKINAAVDEAFLCSQNTALNTEASISQPGSPVDTERSRLYEVDITGGLPADLSGQDGLDGFSYVVEDDATSQTITARGRYTSLGGTQARDQYLASIDNRVDAIKAALGGTWELVRDRHVPDDTDQEVAFERVYRRLLYYQAAGALDHVALKDVRLSVARGRRTRSGDPKDNPLQEVGLTYVANVRREEVDDANGVVQLAKVLDLWEDTVRPWLVENIRQIAGTERMAILFELPRLSFDPPAIQAQMQAIAQGPGGNVIRTAVTTVDRVSGGRSVALVHPEGDVDPDDAAPTPAYVNRAPKIVTREVIQVTRSLGTCSIAPVGEGVNAIQTAFAPGTAFTLSWETTYEEAREGVVGEEGLDVCDRVDRATFQLVSTPRGVQAGGSAGGSAGGVRPR